jgi:Fe(3+) dicitrate transport protein
MREAVRTWMLISVLALASNVRAQEPAEPEPEPDAENDSEPEADDLFPDDDELEALIVSEEDITIPDVVVTATAEAERESETGGAVSRLDERRLERFDYDDPNSVLAQVPNVTLRHEDGYGLRPNIGLRGVNADRSTRITLMEDGVLFAPAPYAAPAAYYFPMMQRMTGVDVFMGPATIPYGPRTVGGAIDLRTREIPRDPHGAIDLALGSTWFTRAHAYYGASNEWGGFLVEGAYARSDGFKHVGDPEDGEDPLHTGFDRGELVLRGELRGTFPDDVYHRLELRAGVGAEVSNETYLGLTDEDFRRDPYLRYEASELDRMSWWRTEVQLRHRLEWGDDFELRTTAYRHDFDRAWNKVNAIGGTPSPGTTQSRRDLFDTLLHQVGANPYYVGILRGTEETSGADDYVLIGTNARRFGVTGVSSDAIGRFTTDPLRHQIRGGVRLHHDEVDRHHTEDAYAMVGGELSRATDPSYTTLLTDAQALAFSAYLSWSVSWETLTITPGIRTELIWTSYSDALTGLESADFRQAYLPGGAIQWQIIPEVQVFGGVMRGFAPVAPGQASNVSPEESITYELGGRLSSRSTGTDGELSLFVNDYTNFLAQCSFSAGCAADAEDDQANAGTAIIAGLDARIGQEIRLGEGASIPLRASYTFTYTELRSAIERSPNPQYAGGRPGDHLPYVPEHQFGAQAGIELREFGLNVSGSFVSEMWEAVGNGDELTPVPRTDPYFLLDAAMYLRPFEQLRIYVRGENLTNTQAIVARRPFGARPNRPLLIHVGVAIEF